MKQEMPQELGFVFVHGAGLNGGVWNSVVDELGHPYLEVDYPMRSGSAAPGHHLKLEDYVTHMTEQVRGWKTHKFVIVAHSLGGVFALEMAAQLSDRAVGFVAIGAAIPRRGRSFVSILPFPQRVIMPWVLRMAGTKPPEFAIRKGLCSDLPVEHASRIAAAFVPESRRVYTDRIQVAVPDIPKLYVKLTRDKEFGGSTQDTMIANLSPDGVESLDTGHLPMLSNPGGVRRILKSFAAQVNARHSSMISS
ncbi:alpha/beta hydrolase [Paenibacillus glucanolyticus]|jgi:pimeloyl-ACP methyl ester carboxylesterase|uniref:alpha/beta fold hydrolase n=1 Tax=Paenibacillus TaxID=44249 RepID=UPI0003E2555A|nr:MULTISPECIES: alpha/beta hydrolase [Paenibacillus]ANA79350.1 alpha/beta hydrolase [Paenibacillus glucanolyticus]AVV56705.1 alpha/beta hydrolase [Paenibacillus glucanolyticus]ETT29750.1 alpha/beta hydrolase fold protein [Paenibacillus sp. FSL R5-808]